MSLNLEGYSVSATVNSHVNDKSPEHFIAEIKAKYEEHYQKHQFLQTLNGHVQYDLHGRRFVQQRNPNHSLKQANRFLEGDFFFLSFFFFKW